MRVNFLFYLVFTVRVKKLKHFHEMAGPLIHRRVKVVSVQWTNEITIHNEQHPKSRA